MFGRKREGSVVCPSCGSLVGVRDDRCYMCGRANPSLWGFAPLLRGLGNDFGFVPFTIGVCVLIYLLSLAVSSNLGQGGAGLNFLAPNGNVLVAFGASGADPLFLYGAWWTVLTASWLHGSLPHILFNMMAVRSIGPLTVNLIGPGRTIVVYVIAGVAGFLLTSFVHEYFPYIPFLGGASVTVGASASICGLIGAIGHYGQRSGSSAIRAQTTQWAIMLAISGVLLRGVDNVAHLGGFVGGYAISALFNPLTRERGDHMLIAIGCLAVSALAVAYGVIRTLVAITS